MKRSLRSWLWRVPLGQEFDEEIELHIEKKSFSSGVILSAMVMTFAEELMERSLLKRLPMRS